MVQRRFTNYFWLASERGLQGKKLSNQHNARWQQMQLDLQVELQYYSEVCLPIYICRLVSSLRTPHHLSRLSYLPVDLNDPPMAAEDCEECIGKDKDKQLGFIVWYVQGVIHWTKPWNSSCRPSAKQGEAKEGGQGGSLVNTSNETVSIGSWLMILEALKILLAYRSHPFIFYPFVLVSEISEM